MSPLAPPYQRWRGFFLLIVCVSILVWGIESWRRSTPDIGAELPAEAEASTGSPVVEPLAQPFTDGETVSGSTSRSDDNAAQLTQDPGANQVLAGRPVERKHARFEDHSLRSRKRSAHDSPKQFCSSQSAISRRLTVAATTESGARALFSELEDCVFEPQAKGPGHRASPLSVERPPPGCSIS